MSSATRRLGIMRSYRNIFELVPKGNNRYINYLKEDICYMFNLKLVTVTAPYGITYKKNRVNNLEIGGRIPPQMKT